MAALRQRPDGFRERGDQVTRLEAFVDAAFAFAVTLLVISFDSMPSSVEGLVDALKGTPAFAAGFAQLALFWWAHHTWSRRFGLDDGLAVLLSLVLVALALVYVYPLRMLFASFFAWITDGWIPAGFMVDSLDDVRTMFVVYAIAWTTLCTVVVLLYAHAWRRRAQLELALEERVRTRSEIARWLYAASLGALSLAIAMLLPPRVPNWAVGAPGMAYGLMALTGVVMGLSERRQRPRIVREMATAPHPAQEPPRLPPRRRRR
ncbi:MAG TPA: TMEM175 family protein, partial [Xanthomonadales bacterium]|nr:TMEM175 family protein [Xanthomonadales bacterium]